VGEPWQWAPVALRNGGKTEKIKLLYSVPVAWVYMTGWASPDGATYFRRDIYGLDKGTKLPVRASGRGLGLGLPSTYAAWILIMAALYPACRWFAEVKRRRRDLAELFIMRIYCRTILSLMYVSSG
jgi:hypothetical protein